MRETSDALRLEGELYGQISVIRKGFYILANGPKSEKRAEEAMELDPENPRAILLKANRYVYAPKIYGGNADKGITWLNKVNILNPEQPDILFDLYTAFSVCYREKKEWSTSLDYIRKAEVLYPENLYLHDRDFLF